MHETIDLFTSTDVAKVRKQLYDEQQGKCLLSGIEVPLDKMHCDHKHDDEQLVRGALHHQANMALGRLESLAVRYLYWYPHGLAEFLRAAADYLDREPDRRWRHTGWMAKLKTKFNKLTSQQMDSVLLSLGSTKGKNLAERKKLFAKQVLCRDLGYTKILEAINQQRK